MIIDRIVIVIKKLRIDEIFLRNTSLYGLWILILILCLRWLLLKIIQGGNIWLGCKIFIICLRNLLLLMKFGIIEISISLILILCKWMLLWLLYLCVRIKLLLFIWSLVT